MNRFIVDYHPDAIAKALCDQHVVKMPLEEAQMLCTACGIMHQSMQRRMSCTNQYIRSTHVHYGQWRHELTIVCLVTTKLC